MADTDDLMENRRLQGRAAISKKLKFNSDFLMGQTLNPQANVWTKWHQERMVNQEMTTRDVPNAANKRYIEVSRFYLLQEKSSFAQMN